MAGIVNAHWYVRNANRNYPLAIDAGCADPGTGIRLPSNILVDLNLRYPLNLGRYPFVSSVTVTPTLVSLTFQAATDPLDASTFSPLGAFSMPVKSLQAYRNYAISPQAPGVGGWLVLGEGALQGPALSIRLPSPAAGRLSPRAARAYRPYPVIDIGALLAADSLTGTVGLEASAPLYIRPDLAVIEGVERTVIRIGLQDTAPAVGQNSTTPSVFETFAGPCGARPESLNCGGGEPIQLLNAVAPDCNGNITIEFFGCAVLGAVEGGSAAVLDCGLGLTDACAGSGLPTADGTLPNEYNDLCSSESISIPTPGGTTGGSPHGGPGTYYSEIPEPSGSGTLPVSETLEVTAPDFAGVSGSFVIMDGTYSSVPSRSDVQPNLAIWNGFDATAIDRSYAVTARIQAGGTLNNAALVVDWRPNPDFSGRYLYYAAILDYDNQQFAIQRFDGTRLQPTAASASLVGIALGRRYRISMTATLSGSSVLLTAKLKAMEGPALTVTLTLTTNDYSQTNGLPGLYANRALAEFINFSIEAV